MKTAFVASLVALSLADDVVSMLAMHVASRSANSDAERVHCLGQLDCAPSASTTLTTTGGLVLGPDWYKPYEGKNCFPGSGASIDGIENDLIGGHNLGLTPIECEAACDADPLCNCFTRSRDGKCWKRNDCRLEACADDEEFDTYIVMESYTKHDGRNCHADAGATSRADGLDFVGGSLTVEECQAACDVDASCTCVTMHTSGACWKRESCTPNDCDIEQEGFDSWTVDM